MNAPAQAAAPSAFEKLQHQLARSKPHFFPLLGHSNKNVDKFVEVVLNAALGNADLLEADRRSFIAACMKAALDGLVPDGREAVLNVYNVKVTDKRTKAERWVQMVQYLPMVGGYIKRLYEHPDVELVDAAVVYEKDLFKWIRGDKPRLEHEPYPGDDPGKIIASYMCVTLKNGQIKREVMFNRDIQAVRAVSKSGSGASSPWVKWPDQQAIKSVIKRGSKQLPRTNNLDQLDQIDNEALGFTGTPAAVADMAARHKVPALENEPSDFLEPVIGADEGEVVEVQAHQQEQRQQQAEDEPTPKPLLTNEEFTKKAPSLKKALAAGEAVNDLVTALETRNTLSLDQKMEIAAWGDKPDTTTQGAAK